MAKMGSRKHLKTYKAPKTWPIHPKEDTWTWMSWMLLPPRPKPPMRKSRPMFGKSTI